MKDYFGYRGKTCVITGAGSGIGKATAEMLVDLGANVYVLNRSPVEINGIKKYIHADVGNKKSIDNAFKHVPKKIDCFFGCAGVSGANNNFNETFTINFIGGKYIIEKYLSKRIVKGGAIAFITSVASLRWERYKNELKKAVESKGWEPTIKEMKSWKFENLPGMTAYSVSKRALGQYIAHMVPFFAKKGIRINALLPSVTDTKLLADFGKRKALVKFSGLAKRLADPIEMAGPLIFLNSNMASYMSGHELIVDYGNESMVKNKAMKDQFDVKTFSFKDIASKIAKKK